MKKYLSKNVLDASINRIEYIFSEFKHVSISCSAGKDSSIMIQLFNIVGRRLNRKFDVLFIDLEADYTMTITHLNELKLLSQINTFEHICLPIEINNGVSIFNPKWICWDESCEDKWIRDLPVDSINIDNHKFGFFKKGMGWYEFLEKYSKYKKRGKDKYVSVIGLRADESYYRFKTIAFGFKKYENTNYIVEKTKGIYNAYPIYDYKTQDVWGAVFKFNFTYNKVYDFMTMDGLSIHQQRVSQPYGNDQKVGLKQWAIIEPESWSKVVNRLSGTNMSALYCKSSLLGNNGSSKPDHLSWQQYSVFLLESLGIYDRGLMDHYYRKIKVFFGYYSDKGISHPNHIKDVMTKKEMAALSDNGKWIHWKRIALCIEKNDFACRTLTYGLTIEDKNDMIKLKSKWGKLLGIQTDTKPMRELAKEIGYEED